MEGSAPVHLVGVVLEQAHSGFWLLYAPQSLHNTSCCGGAKWPCPQHHCPLRQHRL